MRPADEIRSLLEEQALCWNEGELAPDLAIAAGQYRVEAAAEPGSPPRTGWFSLVLRRRDREWQIVLDHPA
jgi:ketosteroid isomerase-like protein